MSARFFRASLSRGWTAGVMLVIAPAVLAMGETPPQDSVRDVTDYLVRSAGESLGPPGGEVRSLVVAPGDPDRLYLGSSLGHLYRSDDRGRSWRETELAVGHEAVIDNLLVPAGNVDTVYAAFWRPNGTGGLVRSDDGGDSWRPLDLRGTPSLRALTQAPSDPDVLYAGGIGGVWRSDDAGESWYNVNGQGLAADFIESLAVDPRDPDHVYAGTWRQVYRSRDGGSTWSRVYQGMALDRDVFSIAISPHDPDLVFAGTCNYLYCSTNAGNSWGERRRGLASEHNRVHTIVHDPDDPETIYAGTRGALYRSRDGGVEWQVLVGGIAVSALAVDEDGELLIGTEERGVLAGPAEGPFEERNTGLRIARVTAFDTLPGAPRVLFVARADGPLRSSLHLSTDLGRSWRPLGARRELTNVAGLRAQAAPTNRVLVAADEGWFAVTPGGGWATLPSPPGRTRDFEIVHETAGRILAATSEGLFAIDSSDLVATDGAAAAFDSTAASWKPLWTGSTVDTVAAAAGRFVAFAGTDVIVGNVDGSGVRTGQLDAGSERILDAAIDPRRTDLVYAISRTGVFRSRDGGAGWEPLPLPWRAAELRAVAVDPSTPDQFLLLDYRGAIYRAHGNGEHWLILDHDPGMHRAWALRTDASAPGWALVATQGHGLRAISVEPLALPAAGARE